MTEKKRVIREIIIFGLLLVLSVFGFEFIMKNLYDFFGLSHVYSSIEHNINLPLLTWQHIEMSLWGCICSIILGMSIGIFATTMVGEGYRPFIEKLMSLFQAVPTIGFLSVLIPIFGFGILPGVVVLVVTGMMPIVFCTITGLLNVPVELIEVGESVGMSRRDIFLKIKLPSAIPVISAGLRTTSVIMVGVATLAAISGAGGLGRPIFSAGIRGFDPVKLLEGTIPVTLLALLVDRLFELLAIELTNHFSGRTNR